MALKPESPDDGLPIKKLVGKKRTKKEKVEEGQKLVSELVASGELVPTLPLEQRREQTWRLYQMGVPTEVIAQTFGITEREVRHDLQRITEDLSANLLGIGAMGVVSRAYHRYEHMKSEAASLYFGLETTAPLADRISLIRLLKDLEDSQLRMVMQVGAVPKATKFAVRDEQGARQMNDFTPDDAKAILSDVLTMMKDITPDASDDDEIPPAPDSGVPEE